MDTSHLKYWAFISYSHRDARVAKALQRAIETYRLPRRLVGLPTPAGVAPAQLKPLFLDRDELQAGTDLQTIVRDALGQSRYLIVVCSPDAARSPWVNQEIIEFKKLHGESRVLAVIARGEPFASRMAGRETEECFPPALRSEVTATGFADGPALEPIAADLRAHADGRRRGTLKLIAGMIGVGADELIQRDAKRRMRQLALLAGSSLVGMAVMAWLAFSAVRSRNEARVQRNAAHAQRGEAEDLIEFMLGDLRKKLVPVGRLDVLDGVGEKALAYYARQAPDELDPNSLGRRSRAFHLLGELHDQRGQLEQAESAFRKAAATTAQLLARAPQEGQRIFNHAQSVYWVGYLAWRRGEAAAAETAFRQYLKLAEQLARSDGRNLDWLAETAYAHVNVGVVCLNTSRLTEAADAFGRARAVWERISSGKPARAMDLANTIGWMAKTYEAQGNFERAIDAQQEKIRVLGLVPNAAANQQVKRHLRVVNNELARLELALGRVDQALQFSLAGTETAKALVAVDPANTTWLEQLVVSQCILAETQLAAGDRASARESIQVARTGAAKVLALDSRVAAWQVNLRGLVLFLAAQVATAEERPGLISELEDYLEKVQAYNTGDRGVTRMRDFIIARAEAHLALLLAAEKRDDAASVRWQAVAVRMQPQAAAGDLPALTLLAHAHFHLGAVAEARALRQRIESTPYRHPAYADLIQLFADHAGSAIKP